jgi:dolichol-phosphate mannosyltransferase
LEKLLIFTATYNEADNIGPLVREVFTILPSADMLVVDDNSPDGTGRILEELKLTYPRLTTIHRPGKNGLGTAHKLAIKYALAQGYDALVTMDADFSHHPRYLPEMVQKLEDAEFVIGSRFIPGGSCEYPLPRVALSVGANTLTRTLLGIPLRETTTAYRGFRRTLLERMNIDAIRSDGYSFFVESIFQVARLEHAARARRPMREFPIRFEDRRAGATKISKKEIWNGMRTLGRLAVRRALAQGDFSPPEAELERTEACSVCGCAYSVEERPPPSLRDLGAKLRPGSSPPPSEERRVRCLGCGRTQDEPASQRAHHFSA